MKIKNLFKLISEGQLRLPTKSDREEFPDLPADALIYRNSERVILMFEDSGDVRFEMHVYETVVYQLTSEGWERI